MYSVKSSGFLLHFFACRGKNFNIYSRLNPLLAAQGLNQGAYMRRVFAVLMLGCILLMGPSTLFGAEPEVFTAYDIHKAASEDSKAANAQYLGKTVTVKGIVVAKGISRYLTPTVTLSSREGGPDLIVCVLPRLDVGKLSNFEPGQEVTFTGRVQHMGERIILKECTVTENR